jgi:hypothetical protein
MHALAGTAASVGERVHHRRILAVAATKMTSAGFAHVEDSTSLSALGLA